MLVRRDREKISDNRFFHLREAWAKNQISLFDDDAKKDLAALEGRFAFCMDDTALLEEPEDKLLQSRRFVVVRFDVEHGKISGDIFGDRRQTDWYLSFRSEALFRNVSDPNRTTINAIAEVFAPNVHGKKLPPSMKLVIAIDVDHNDDNRLSACRIALLNENRVSLDLTKSDVTPLKPDQSFRKIKIQPKYIEGQLTGAELAVLKETLETDSTNLRNELRDASRGLKLDLELAPLIGVRSINGPSDEYLTFMRSQFSDDPFLFNVVFSKQTTKDGEGFFGEAKGISLTRPRFRARSTAMVYVSEIIKITKATLKQQGQNPTKAKTDTIIKERIRHTVIHELGHLLNLPHPWQRNKFAALGMQSDPSDKTWMAYGSLYPFGALNGHSRTLRAIDNAGKNPDLKDATRWAARADSLANMKNRKHLHEPGFSEQETTWLRHAPHDWIAAGYRTFTDELRRAPRLSHAFGKGFKLELLGDLDPAMTSAVTHALYVSEGVPSKSQPIFGRVLLDGEAFGIEFDRLEASFQTDTLQLLIRREPADGVVDAATRPMRILPRIQLNYDDRYIIDGNPTPLADYLLQKSVHPTPKGSVIERKIPLVLPSFLTRNFGGPALFHFTVQALFRPHGHKGPIYSNKVRVDYVKTGDTVLGDAGDLVRPILTHPLLPELAELASSWADIRPEAIYRRERFGDQRSRVFEPLVQAITALPEEHRKPELEWLFNIRNQLIS